MKKNLLRILAALIAIPLLYMAFLLFVVGPVDNNRENCVAIAGELVQIVEGSSNDVIFILKADPHPYYVNRDLERDLKVEELKQQLLGKKIDLWYAKTRSMPGGHLCHIEYDGKVFYSEWK